MSDYFTLEQGSPSTKRTPRWDSPLTTVTGRFSRRVAWTACVVVAAVTLVCVSNAYHGLYEAQSAWMRTAAYATQPRIAIFQHLNMHNERARTVQELSRAQHQRYADFWGYDYVCSTKQYVPEAGSTVRQRQMNKVYGLLDLAIAELAKGDQGAEWIHITDADVMIVDPSVPLHSLIPAHDARPAEPAFILGSEDWNGFNSGSMIYRCGVEMVAFLSHVLALSDDITKEYAALTANLTEKPREGPDGIESPPSDQRAVCLVLEQVPAYAERFYHYAQRWLNSYDMPNAEEEGKERVQLHTHLVADAKYRDSYQDYIDREEQGWERIAGLSKRELEEREEEVRKVARNWWSTARIGVPKCIWV